MQVIALDLRVLLKHTELPLAAGQGHYFPAHVLDREARSPLAFQNRNPFPSPHLQVQVLMNVPAKTQQFLTLDMLHLSVCTIVRDTAYLHTINTNRIEFILLHSEKQVSISQLITSTLKNHLRQCLN